QETTAEDWEGRERSSSLELLRVSVPPCASLTSAVVSRRGPCGYWISTTGSQQRLVEGDTVRRVQPQGPFVPQETTAEDWEGRERSSSLELLRVSVPPCASLTSAVVSRRGPCGYWISTTGSQQRLVEGDTVRRVHPPGPFGPQETTAEDWEGRERSSSLE